MMPFPDYIDQRSKIVFFTDFDGTVTKEDSCDWLIANGGLGYEKMQEGFRAVLSGERTYRDVSREQFDSIRTPFDQCIEKVLDNVSLDEHFLAFYEWCTSFSIPLIILSGGLTPLIQALLATAIGHELHGVKIVANTVALRDGYQSINDTGGAWRVQFHDDSVYGHDKARTIRSYAEHWISLPEEARPIFLYAGDGVSDLSAARETDLLFAKKGKDLVKYCKEQKLPFTEFEDWRDILTITKDLYFGRKTVAEVFKETRHEEERKLPDQEAGPSSTGKRGTSINPSGGN